jgi:DNA-binding MarR family transcriptional regulator
MVRRKLIQRVKDPEDSRITLLSLTPKGQEKLNEIDAFLEGIHLEVLSQLAPEQRKAMLTNLELLKGSMEAVKELMV